ncbi:hypothetical protein AMK22_08530 [Streptomyces sp. CB01580]|nr:hypothetical protein AMK22_08530 [Streptomyces sp. CB01580]
MAPDVFMEGDRFAPVSGSEFDSEFGSRSAPESGFGLRSGPGFAVRTPIGLIDGARLDRMRVDPTWTDAGSGRSRCGGRSTRPYFWPGTSSPTDRGPAGPPSATEGEVK